MRGLHGSDLLCFDSDTAPHMLFKTVNTLALMEEFKSLKLDEMNAKYCNSKQDRHYFGLAKSIIIGVRRMARFCDDSDARTGTTGSKRATLGLLMALLMIASGVAASGGGRLAPPLLLMVTRVLGLRFAKETS